MGFAAARIALQRASVWSSRSKSPEYDFESLAAAALFGAAKAITNYDPAKAMISTYVAYCAEKEMLHSLRDERNTIKIPSWLYEAGIKPVTVVQYDGFDFGDDASFEDFIPAPVRDVSWYDSDEWDAVLQSLEIVAAGGAGCRAARPLGVGMNKMQSVLPKLRRYLNDEAEDPYAFDFAHYWRTGRR